jgi:prevent-host-death family protein
MTTISIVEARNKLADALNRVSYGGERVALARRGKPVAVLVSVEDAELLEKLEEAGDLREARKALADYHKNPARAVPFETVLKRASHKS